MDPFVITVICIVFVAAIAVGVYFVMRNMKSNATTDKKGQGTIITRDNTELVNTGKSELRIRFEDLPILTEEEETRLVEVNDNKLKLPTPHSPPNRSRIRLTPHKDSF